MKKYNWNELSEVAKQQLLMRPTLSANTNIVSATKDIIDAVKINGDKCLFELAKKFDHVALSELQVTLAEIDSASANIHLTARKAIKFAKKQIECTHNMQLPKTQRTNSCEGVTIERQARAIARVGLYVPGGTAPLVSTVLMLAMPAQIANCAVRILCTPPNRDGKIDPHILFAAKISGIQAIYKVGGAQAIAAMAYGTASIPKVDKIFGPGNAWVTQAKILVSEDPDGASIDMPAGPSEVMVIADAGANPDYVAADLLSQAEHGVDSQVMLVTTSASLADQVTVQMDRHIQYLARRDIIKKSLDNSRIIIVNDILDAIAVSNLYAPEHLILQVANAQNYAAHILHAGAVFLGPWSAEALGDYVTGSNHVLPTYGYARTYSGLSVQDFMKFISFQTVTAKGLQIIGPHAKKIAEVEGLDAHKLAVSLRLNAVEQCDEQYS